MRNRAHLRVQCHHPAVDQIEMIKKRDQREEIVKVKREAEVREEVEVGIIEIKEEDEVRVEIEREIENIIKKINIGINIRKIRKEVKGLLKEKKSENNKLVLLKLEY